LHREREGEAEKNPRKTKPLTPETLRAHRKATAPKPSEADRHEVNDNARGCEFDASYWGRESHW
jgi:hypothetical protein